MSENKVHPDLRRALAVAGAEDRVPIIIRYRPTPAGIAAAVAVEISGLSIVASYEIVPAAAAEGTPGSIGQLSEMEHVERIWYDMPVHTMLDKSVPKIGAPQLWEKGLTGKGVKVAILDTGVDLQHPDLQGRISVKSDFTGKGSVQDGNGHGTHVASTVAGSGAASAGLYRGVAPDAELYIAKVLDDQGGGRMSTVISGLEWAVQQSVDVINMSLGSDTASDGTDALSEAVDAAVAAGIVAVVAAGNAGPGPRTVGSPGSARDALTIGASNDDDGIANFSSRGPTLDGRVKPDVVFPGNKIIAARAKGTSLGRSVDDNYAELSGTSMATPHAAGAVALLLEANPGLTPQQIKERLMSTAVDLEQDANSQGTGRANLLAAWQAGETTPGPTPPTEPTPQPEPAPVTPTPKPTTPPPSTGCLLSILRVFGLFQ